MDKTLDVVNLIKYKFHYDWMYNAFGFEKGRLYKVVFGGGSYGFGFSRN